MKTIRIATRESPLALWQAEYVQKQIRMLYPAMNVVLTGVKTRGDLILDKPLSEAGGKGLFLKELEQKLLNHTADIAVHSMKDVTIELPSGLVLAIIMSRADPRDVFIANQFGSIVDLPDGSCVGTSSLRRQTQLRAKRPGLVVKDLRGNIGTRLKKLDNREYDAIILAAAGVKRLNLEYRIKEYLPTDMMLPAVGQGAIGLEIRTDDTEIKDLLQPLNNKTAAIQVSAERAFSRRLYGGCQLPIAAYAEIEGEDISLQGLVGSVDGSKLITGAIKGSKDDAEKIGLQLAEELLRNGADKILQELIND